MCKFFTGDELRTVIHFEDGVDFEVFSYETDVGTIESLSLSERLANTSGNILGVITGNSLNVKIVDKNNVLSVLNADSTFDKYVKHNIKIEAFNKERDADDWSPIGTFVTDGWSNNITEGNKSTVSISGHDEFHDYCNMSLPNLRAYINVPISMLVDDIFNKIGLSNRYIFDSSLDVTLPVSVSTENTVRDALNLICQAILARASMGRDGIVRFTSVLPKINTYKEINELMIKSVGGSENYNNTYKGVQVSYSDKNISDSSDVVADIQNYKALSGVNKLDRIKLDTSIYALDYIKMEIGFNSSIDVDTIEIKYTGYQSGIDVTVINNSDTEIEIKSIKIYAYKLNKTDYVSGDTGENVLKLSNNYLQGKDTVEAYILKVKEYLDKNKRILTVDTSIDTNTTYNDVLRFNLADIGIKGMFLVIASNVTFSNSYNHQLELIKLSDLD